VAASWWSFCHGFDRRRDVDARRFQPERVQPDTRRGIDQHSSGTDSVDAIAAASAAFSTCAPSGPPLLGSRMLVHFASQREKRVGLQKVRTKQRGVDLRLRPVRLDDEEEFIAAHEAMQTEGFPFGLGYEPGLAWAEYVERVPGA
jgi:hypothetical protein